MLAKVYGYALAGLDGVVVNVETDVSRGLPSYEIVGLPDTAVKESKERVKSAIKNSKLNFPNHKIIVNLAPAYVKKEGSTFDLPIAISLLCAEGELPQQSEYVFLGELALNGDLRAVRGILPAIISARDKGFTKFILPKCNAREASYVYGIEAYGASSLLEVVEHLTGVAPLPKIETRDFSARRTTEEISAYDLSLVKGQPIAKRALEVAVAGGHNILFVGPPGSGKTMLARAIPTILPDLSKDEALEITKIHSVAGTLGEDGIVTIRPFRSPHHTATTVALCGGGNKSVHPGEISLAHGGVLFLDELPEYKRSTLESLRQPLEDGVITVSRAGGTVTFPASFTLCASMNPCPCGNFGSKQRKCVCTPNEIRKYRAKVSGPLLDRIDIQVEVDGVTYDDLVATADGETSAQVKARADQARRMQRHRFEGSGVQTNAQMGERETREFCALSKEGEDVLREAFDRLRLSARARGRILKVARTIADLDYSEWIEPKHLYEAVSYRVYGAETDTE